MNKLFYPALFHKAEEGGFWVTFPDLPECMTQGDNMEEAYNYLLNDINIIVAIIIVVMSIFIYSLTKYPIYISFVIVYSLAI